MKTTIEVNGYEIVIEETDGMVSVSALKDGETVEEFSLEGDMPEGSDKATGEEEISTFDEFEEEEDLGDDIPDEFEGGEEEEEEEEEENEIHEDDLEEENEDEEEEEEEEKEAPALESFSSFINKKKKDPKKNEVTKKK